MQELIIDFGFSPVSNEVTEIMNPIASWQFWAILAAIFAALTAIFAKVGVADIDSDLATFV